MRRDPGTRLHRPAPFTQSHRDHQAADGGILAAIAMQMIVTSLQVAFPLMAEAAGHA